MADPMMRVAVAQNRIVADVRQNGRHVRSLIEQAAAAGARLVQFPEGALSGYIKAQIKTWDAVDWPALDAELAATAELARRLGIWAVIGCNQRLAPPLRPHNGLLVISDQGRVAARYGKRFCSHTEVTSWYTPAVDPVTFEVDGIRFGCALCIEVCFPELFAEYERLGVDCVLLSSYSEDPVHGLMARAHAATNCFWVGLSTPAQCSRGLPGTLIGPDGSLVAECAAGRPDLAVGTLDRDAPQFAVALRLARPWRARARSGEIYAAEAQQARQNDGASHRHIG